MKAKGSHSTDRKTIRRPIEIINVGKSAADDLVRIGIRDAQQLVGNDPWSLYCRICRCDGFAHDPCLLDLLMSAVDYMNGNPPKKWWKYTAQRKRRYAQALQAMPAGKMIVASTSRTKKRRSK